MAPARESSRLRAAVAEETAHVSPRVAPSAVPPPLLSHHNEILRWRWLRRLGLTSQGREGGHWALGSQGTCGRSLLRSLRKDRCRRLVVGADRYSALGGAAASFTGNACASSALGNRGQRGAQGRESNGSGTLDRVGPGLRPAPLCGPLGLLAVCFTSPRQTVRPLPRTDRRGFWVSI